jgi:hypothetical protein
MGKRNSYFTSDSTRLQTESFELYITTLTLNKLTIKVPMARQDILEINSLSVRNANSWKKKYFLLKTSNNI